MAASPSQVVEVLKNTPKGKLPYTSPLNNLPSNERIAYIKSLSTPPQLSPVIVLDYIQRNSITPQTPPSPPTPLSFSSTSSNVSDYDASLSPSQVLFHATIDEDLLSVNEFKELEVSVQRHVDKYSKCKHDIESTHDIRITEIQHEAESRRHEHKLERLQEETIIRREVEREMQLYAMSRQQHSDAIKKRIEENREIMRQREEEIKRERKELFVTLEKDVLTLSDKVQRIIESCRYIQLMDATPFHTFATHSKDIIKMIIEQKKSLDPDPTVLESVKVMVAQLLPLLTVVKERVETANKTGDELIKKQQEEEAKKQQAAAQHNTASITTSTSTITTSTSTGNTSISANTTGTSTSTSTVTTSTSTVTASTSTNTGLPPALQEYEELNKKLIEAVKLSSEFTSNTQLKRYRYSLQSAIAYMVGSISSDNGGRLLSLVKQIQHLLGGQTVEVLEKRVSINDHPLARNFCLHLLVKKMIDRVTEAPRNAFPVAGVVLLLWRDMNEFGQLFLAQCYQTCPLLVPIITQRTPDISEIDYKRLIGYRVSDDGATVESDDQFIDRMTPCIRLYGALLQTDIVDPHPHGLDKGWTLLARILNNDPLGSITIIILNNILEVAGHALLKKYKGQFKKLLHILYSHYMDKIKPLSSPLDISKLQMFFDNFIKEGRIERPAGALTLQFWNERERLSYQVD